MSKRKIEEFVRKISMTKCDSVLFNPYHGIARTAKICRLNLFSYLIKIYEINPTVLLIGEAPGYRGCRLTGVPFSSEKLLATHSFFGKEFCVSGENKERQETSAKIVWDEIDRLGFQPLIWNAFPFHPHKKNHPKSNRMPRVSEMKMGEEFIHDLLEIFTIEQIIAVGRRAELQCSRLELENTYVRHPSHGGKKEFCSAMRKEFS